MKVAIVTKAGDSKKQSVLRRLGKEINHPVVIVPARDAIGYLHPELRIHANEILEHDPCWLMAFVKTTKGNLQLVGSVAAKTTTCHSGSVTLAHELFYAMEECRMRDIWGHVVGSIEGNGAPYHIVYLEITSGPAIVGGGLSLRTHAKLTGDLLLRWVKAKLPSFLRIN